MSTSRLTKNQSIVIKVLNAVPPLDVIEVDPLSYYKIAYHSYFIKYPYSDNSKVLLNLMSYN